MPAEAAPVSVEDIQRTLKDADRPLNSAALSKRLKQKSGKTFKPVLDREVKAGRIYSWDSKLYWDRNPSVTARERLLKLAASEIWTAKPLVKRAAAESPKLGERFVAKVRHELTREGLLREVAPHRGSKNRSKLIVNVRNPEPYLESAITRLLVDFAIERSKEEIQKFLAAPPIDVPKSDVSDVAEKMFAAMNRIAHSPGTTVTFYRLRQQPELAQVPKAIFDEAALLLQRERRALLAVHDHAGHLPKAQQDEFVTDGLGTYYVSIYSI
jgi:hypothetical protein